MKLKIMAVITVLLLSVSGVYAELHDRGNGLIYDDILNVTWLQDANYAQTSGYDNDGLMNWNEAMVWADQLEYGGYDDWRLPITVDAPYAYGFDGTTNAGYNITSSEMGHLYYVTLGNLGRYDIYGNQQSGWGLSNSDPFENLQTSLMYWSETVYSHDYSNQVSWDFGFSDGLQSYSGITSDRYAWAVRDGDVTPQPILLGWDYPNGLITVNPLTAGYKTVLESNRQFEAMAYDPANKLLYAIENLGGDNLLVSIDNKNGIITDIGYIAGYSEITSMTFDRTTNTLYAIDQATRTLLEVDPQTAFGTAISNYTFGTSNALAAHPLTGELYLGWSVDPSYLTIVDKTTGELTLIGSMGINSITALEFHPETFKLYGAGQFYIDGHHLFTVDLATGIVNSIGPVGQVLSLAFIDQLFEPTIDDIIDFFNESVEEGTLYGQGKRQFLANFRLWIMREMLETVKNLIEKDEIEFACKALNRAFLRCDSDPWPIDFVEGEAVEELANMILELMNELECE